MNTQAGFGIKYNLANDFESIPHSDILAALNFFHVPETITKLVRNFLKDLQYCRIHNIMAIIGSGYHGRVHHILSSLHHDNRGDYLGI